MRTLLATTVLLLLMLSDTVWSQGNPWASPEPSIKISRSSEHQAEGQEFEKAVPVTLEYQQKGCAASLGLQYYQKGTHAHVTSTLANEQCAASSGSYVIRIRYRPDEGEQGEVQFEETWSRDDAADIVIEKNYFVGDDLEVRRVSSSGLTCVCTAPAETEETDATPAAETLRHKDRE
jgi:hypothetical protein